MIRYMTNKDVECVAEIERLSILNPWSSQSFLETLSYQQHIFLVYEEADTVKGYIGVYVAADEGEITGIAIHPEYRKQKIGTKLFHFALSEAENASIKKIYLEVRTSNQSAIAFYNELGFEIDGIRKGFYSNPKEDGVVMHFSLDD